DLPLPARAINALKNAELLVVADLVQQTDADLEQVKNLGDKSIEEIKTALAALGLSLGMRIDPNLLGTLGRGGVKGGTARPGSSSDASPRIAGLCSGTSSSHSS